MIDIVFTTTIRLTMINTQTGAKYEWERLRTGKVEDVTRKLIGI